MQCSRTFPVSQESQEQQLDQQAKFWIKRVSSPTDIEKKSKFLIEKI